MKLYYYVDSAGNFGDDLNPWLWQKLIPGLLDERDDRLFIGIGTLLNDLVPDGPEKVVFGSGVGYGRGLPGVNGKWKFYCVRGPITAAKLNLPGRYVITDAAALVSKVYTANEIKSAGVAFMPHHKSASKLNWAAICAEAGIRYIDPRRNVEDVLGEVVKSSAIITEAMHGAIIADSFRIPWMPVVLYDYILEMKWHDWAQSLGLSYSPVRLDGIYNTDHVFPHGDRLKFRVKRALCNVGGGSARWTPPPRKSTWHEIHLFKKTFRKIIEEPALVLSQDSVFDSTLARLSERLEQLKKDYKFVRGK